MDEKNQNTAEYLDFVQTKCLANLKSLEHAPNVGTLDYVVKDFYSLDNIESRNYSKSAHPQEDEYDLPAK